MDGAFRGGEAGRAHLGAHELVLSRRGRNRGAGFSVRRVEEVEVIRRGSKVGGSGERGEVGDHRVESGCTREVRRVGGWEAPEVVRWEGVSGRRKRRKEEDPLLIVQGSAVAGQL